MKYTGTQDMFMVSVESHMKDVSEGPELIFFQFLSTLAPHNAILKYIVRVT